MRPVHPMPQGAVLGCIEGRTRVHAACAAPPAGAAGARGGGGKEQLPCIGPAELLELCGLPRDLDAALTRAIYATVRSPGSQHVDEADVILAKVRRRGILRKTPL
jgi:hypothetical protein